MYNYGKDPCGDTSPLGAFSFIPCLKIYDRAVWNVFLAKPSTKLFVINIDTKLLCCSVQIITIYINIRIFHKFT